MRYKTLPGVIEAFKAGELNDWQLSIDNDCISLHFIGENPYEQDSDEALDFEDKMYDEGQELFSLSPINPMDMLIDTLNYINIPADGA